MAPASTTCSVNAAIWSVRSSGKCCCRINRFNREAVETLQSATADPALSLGQFVRERQYGEHFLNYYLLPMSCAVWSSPPDRMLQFPALTLLRFFHNHGFLGLHTQHPWRTVAGGARQYVARISAPFRDRIRLQRAVVEVRRTPQGVRVTDETGAANAFDHVILACHADQALRLLQDADDHERDALGQFEYQPNMALLHTDERVMPRRARCWSSWNYRIDRHADGRPGSLDRLLDQPPAGHRGKTQLLRLDQRRGRPRATAATAAHSLRASAAE